MEKRRICKIAETGLQLTSVTSLAIGFVPYILGEYNDKALILGTGIGTAALLGSLVPHNVLYRLKQRDQELEANKKSDTYKKSLEKDMEKLETFGMYVINKTYYYPEELRKEIFCDFDIDMEILEHRLSLLEEDDEEQIDYLFERINELSSYIKSEEYDNLRDKYYKSKDNNIINFRNDNKKEDSSNNILKLIKKKISNDKKE